MFKIYPHHLSPGLYTLSVVVDHGASHAQHRVPIREVFGALHSGLRAQVKVIVQAGDRRIEQRIGLAGCKTPRVPQPLPDLAEHQHGVIGGQQPAMEAHLDRPTTDR